MSRKSGIVFSYLLVTVQTLSSILFTPFVIRGLGQAEYGVYTLIISITSYIMLLDLGVGNALVRYISKYRINGDEKRQNNLIGITTVFYLVMALIGLAVGIAVFYFIPSIFAKGLTAPEISRAKIMLLITVAGISVQLVATAYSKVIIAYERFALFKSASIIVILIRIPVSIAALMMGGRGIALVAINFVLTVGRCVFFIGYVLYRLKIRPSLKGAEFSFIKEIIIFSAWIFVQMIATQINSMTDQTLIGILVPASSVILGIYAVGIQVSGYFQSIADNINGVLMPGIVRVVESNANPENLRREMVRIGRYIFMVMALVWCVFLVMGHSFINLWAGYENSNAYYVALIIMLPMVFSLTEAVGNQILWALNKVRIQAILKIAVSLVNIILTIFLIRWNPLIGATIGSFLAVMMGDVVGMNIVFAKDIGISILKYYRELFHGILPCILIALAAGCGIRLLGLGAYGWIGFFINCSLMCFAYALPMWLFGMNQSEKDMIAHLVNRLLIKNITVRKGKKNKKKVYRVKSYNGIGDFNIIQTMLRSKGKTMEKKLYYVGYYNRIGDPNHRASCISAVNLMDSICEMLNQKGIRVTIVSPSYPGKNSEEKTRGTLRERINKKTEVIYCPMITPGSRPARILNVVISQIWILYFLLRNTGPNTNVMLYHAVPLISPVTIARRIKKFHLIVHVAELYADVTGRRKERKRELAFFQQADAYIFASELLENLINQSRKHCTVVYGAMTEFRQLAQKKEDGIIHVVYAGTLDPRKGGAAAVAAAKYLDDRFHIHIIGFGSDGEIEYLQDTIDQTKKNTSCRISYDGMKKGDEYLAYLQSCEIGLSPQDVNAQFNDTSFPSKILSYLSNGLKVVSVRIPAIERSRVGGYLFYYDRQLPKEIADTIIRASEAEKIDYTELMRDLRNALLAELDQLLR